MGPHHTLPGRGVGKGRFGRSVVNETLIRFAAWNPLRVVDTQLQDNAAAELHLEELIDRAAANDIEPVDRARLAAHFARCVACRFVVLVREDLGALNASRSRRC